MIKNNARKYGKLVVLGLLWVCYIPSITLAASFPCDKASTRVERSICSDKELSDLDEYLGRYYSAARLALPNASSCLVSDQKSWLRGTRDMCKDTACMKAAYVSRLGELNGVQPGATVLKNLQLPNSPTLVSIIPPAQDQTAAPRKSTLKPLSVTGKLLNEVSTGDGYVMLAKNGHRHLVAALMFLDDTTAPLEQLSKEASTDYVVRGSAADGEHSDNQAFSQAACRYIYRVQ